MKAEMNSSRGDFLLGTTFVFVYTRGFIPEWLKTVHSLRKFNYLVQKMVRIKVKLALGVGITRSYLRPHGRFKYSITKRSEVVIRHQLKELCQAGHSQLSDCLQLRDQGWMNLGRINKEKIFTSVTQGMVLGYRNMSARMSTWRKAFLVHMKSVLLERITV